MDGTEISDGRSGVQPGSDRALLEAVLAVAEEAIYALDRDYCFIVFNDAAETYFRTSRSDVLGRNIWELFAAGRGGEFEALVTAAMNEGVRSTMSARSALRPGREVEIRIAPMAGGITVAVADITDRLAAQRALSATAEHYRFTVELNPQVVWTALPDGQLDHVSERWFTWTGNNGLGESWGLALHPEDLSPSVAAWTHAVATGDPYDIKHRVRHLSGHFRWARSRAWPRYGADGAIIKWYGTTEDIQERKLSEEDARSLAAVVKQSRDFIAFADRQGQPVFVNEAGLAMMGFANLEAARAHHLIEYFAPDYRALIREVALPSCESNGYWEGEVAFRRIDDGREFPVRYNVFPLRDKAGQVTGYATVTWDLTEIKNAQAALSDSRAILADREERLRLAVENADVGLWDVDLVNDILIWPARTKAMFGISADIAVTMQDFYDGLHPADAQATAAAFAAAADPVARAVYDVEYRTIGREDGVVRWVAAKGRGVFDESGRCLRVIGTALDITARKQTEAELHHLNETLERRITDEVAARTKTEEALRQAQKMEAMGQLTGGVAHDFNNLLTPIIGSLDMLQRKGLGGEREQRLIAGAGQAAERAKILVQRLLSFARRQPLQPVAVDVASLVTGMGDLVSSTTGPQINVVVDAPEGLPPANADPNQLEMALLNLVVNARDAMPGGGTLRISAGQEAIGLGHRSGLHPGTFVRLSVADTGTGMDEATVARAIEPFFSTKGVGQGTGLGLSMVHGLASQLNGALTIQSRPGLGTNIELWLPISTHAPATDKPAGDVAATTAPLGTALLVDDEELVRMSIADMLIDLGYAVIEAASGEEALKLFNTGERIDLVVTDHLMPGMTGTDLAYAIRTANPHIPVLLISGYAENQGVEPGLPRLTKPFRKDELVTSLAELSAN